MKSYEYETWKISPAKLTINTIYHDPYEYPTNTKQT